jgi:hypothetical protein
LKSTHITTWVLVIKFNGNYANNISPIFWPRKFCYNHNTNWILMNVHNCRIMWSGHLSDLNTATYYKLFHHQVQVLRKRKKKSKNVTAQT